MAVKEPFSMSNEDITETFREYHEGKRIVQGITIEFDGMEDPSPLAVLSILDNKPDSSTILSIAETMFDGHKIKFLSEGKELKTIVYNRGAGNSLDALLVKEVYLLDQLLQVTYALLLKKLTPHLENSN